MKPNQEAHRALRSMFTTSMHDVRTSKSEAREMIRQGRLKRAQARACSPTNYALEAEGYSLSAQGASLRQAGNRELCLALAFCNNTLYSDAEKPVHAAKPYRLRIVRFLAPCFLMPALDPRVEMNRAWCDILEAWFAGQKPRAILQALVARHTPEATAQAS